MVGRPLYKQTIASVVKQLNLNYPTHAPWAVLEDELLDDGKTLTRMYLQVYREPGLQPMHFDGGVGWYKDENGYWGPLSVIVSINDGLATFLSPKPNGDVWKTVMEQD